MRGFIVTLSLSMLAAAAGASQAQAQGFGLSSLYGCQADGQRNTTGAVIGGLVGGLAGSQISKNERTLGAVAGAAIGAAIGNSIGCKMDRQAQVQAQNAFQRALETGQAQNWSDQNSGMSGRIEVVGGGGPSSRPYGGDRRHGPPTWEAVGRANVRAQPNVNAPVVDRLQVGEQITTRAPVNGWLPVVERGEVVGYVSVSAVRQSYGPGQYGGGQQYASNDCRVVQETVTTRGYAPETQRYNACRDDRGEWRLTAI